MAAINVFSAENLSKRYGERLLFEGLTFGLSRGQKCAIVAKNGTGKTTLLNGICGVEPVDDGRISMDAGTQWSYLPQDPDYDGQQTILDHLYASDMAAVKAMRIYAAAADGDDDEALQAAYEGMDLHNAWDFEARAKEVLGRLNLHNLGRTMATLSGGERRRIALARVLIEEPDILFLDEPTNHLDLDMIQWLERYLAQSKMTILMITHDRYFLENVCDTILELDDQTLYKYKGNYSYYLEKREERKENALANRAKARGIFKRELEWMRSTPSARTGKSKSRIERFYEIKKAAKKRLEEDDMALRLNPHRLGGKIIELHKVAHGFDGDLLFENLTHHFKRGERIGIVGRNGSGKSTLLDLITKGDAPTRGKVVVGETVVFGHYHQSGANFPEGQRIIEAVYEIAEFMPLEKGQKITAAQLLERFLFPPIHPPPIDFNAERWRAKAPAPPAGVDGQPQFPDPRRADERPRHLHPANPRGIPPRFSRVLDCGQPRPVLHGPIGGTHLGARRFARSPIFPRELQPVPIGRGRRETGSAGGAGSEQSHRRIKCGSSAAQKRLFEAPVVQGKIRVRTARRQNGRTRTAKGVFNGTALCQSRPG